MVRCERLEENLWMVRSRVRVFEVHVPQQSFQLSFKLFENFRFPMIAVSSLLIIAFRYCNQKPKADEIDEC